MNNNKNNTFIIAILIVVILLGVSLLTIDITASSLYLEEFDESILTAEQLNREEIERGLPYQSTTVSEVIDGELYCYCLDFDYALIYVNFGGTET